MLSFATRSGASRQKTSLLFDLELEGFDCLIREQRVVASAVDRLAQLVDALRPEDPGLAIYYDQLEKDALGATEVASTQLRSQAPGGGHTVNLKLFAEVLACCGHKCWLRKGKSAPADADADSSSDAGDASPRFSVGSSAVSRPSLLSAGIDSGANAAGLLSARRHTFVVARAPVAAPACSPPATPLACEDEDDDLDSSGCGGGASSEDQAADGGGGGSGALFVVDPCFKEQFSSASIAATNPVYSALVAALPSVVVGTAEGLAPLVKFFCEQMEVSFAASGTELPPWRDTPYMLSVWFPEAADDVQISRPTSS